jgi:hypothetical protein
MDLTSSGLPPNATPFAPPSAPLQLTTSSFSTPYLNAERDRVFRAQAASDMLPSPGCGTMMMMMKACFLADLTKQDQPLLDLAVKYALVTQILPSPPTYPPPANSLGGEGMRMLRLTRCLLAQIQSPSAHRGQQERLWPRQVQAKEPMLVLPHLVLLSLMLSVPSPPFHSAHGSLV